MKANRRTISPASAAAAALSLLLGACATPPPAPVTPPPPARPLPPPPLAPEAADWHDNPATPGVWQWRREGGRSIARFGAPEHPALLSLACNARTGTITIARAESGVMAGTMRVLTTSLVRALPIAPGTATVSLPARDPLLDAMAFSRGRFAVEASGLETLYLPSWPEVSRVIEDCR